MTAAAASLFPELAEPIAGAVTLWGRPSKRHRWQRIASNDDGARALEFGGMERRGWVWHVSYDGRDPNE